MGVHHGSWETFLHLVEGRESALQVTAALGAWWIRRSVSEGVRVMDMSEYNAAWKTQVGAVPISFQFAVSGGAW